MNRELLRFFGCILGFIFIEAAFLVGPVSAGETEANGCYCVGDVGNVNCDYLDQVTLADLMYLIDHLYINHPRLPSPEEANCDGDPSGEITMSDVMALIDHLFIYRQPLPACPRPYNSPPDTRIVGYTEGISYINSLEPLSSATGVRLQWEASDIVDHPYDTPDFDYEYRLYGPYTDSVLEVILDSFVVPVFRTWDGRIYRQDNLPEITCDTLENDSIYCDTHPTLMVVCDTFWNGGVRTVDCDTILIDTLTRSNAYGFLDTLIRFEDDDFVNSYGFNRLVLQSGEGNDVWTSVQRDSLYDLYRYSPGDTTREENFIFWVRARDPDDSTVVDPTPDFTVLGVIDPKFERDVLVVNFDGPAAENRVWRDTAASAWEDFVLDWIDDTNRQGEAEFDPAKDYVYINSATGGPLDLRRLLSYRTVICHQDAAVAGVWAINSSRRNQVYTAMDVGVNVWVCARVPLGFYSFASPPGAVSADDDYTYHFGVERTYYSGWTNYLLYSMGETRVEHFEGTISMDSVGWPELNVDSTLLHRRYEWNPSMFYPWAPELAALPEVGWEERSFDAEVIYLFRSMYGPAHPIVPELSYHGRPVMHRLDRGLFRSVHSMFTPLALEKETAQQMVDSVMNWLYDGSIHAVGQNPPAQSLNGEVR